MQRLGVLYRATLLPMLYLLRHAKPTVTEDSWSRLREFFARWNRKFVT